MPFPSVVTRLSVVALCAVLGASLPAAAAEVTVFAAASLKTALDQVAASFEAETGDHVAISYAGSNTLARQIVEGAPADIFISASSEWMDVVEKAGDLAPDTRRNLLGNQLVLIAHDPQAGAVELNDHTDLKGLLAGGKLAMGQVDSVPAGQYGKQALGRLGLWDGVQDSVAQADNVRAALALVAAGEAPFGIVYATDAVAEPKVHVAGRFPESSHDPITYPAALTRQAADPADRAFFNALAGPAARKLFEAQGFSVLD